MSHTVFFALSRVVVAPKYASLLGTMEILNIEKKSSELGAKEKL